MQLPYALITLSDDHRKFIFQCLSIDYNTMYVKFGIIYRSPEVNAKFSCDITIGNVYDFYVSLDMAYDLLDGTETKAVLETYGSLDRTEFSVEFDRKGHCTLKSRFLSRESHYQNGINFQMKLDQSYLIDSMKAMSRFFKELSEIQGNSVFY
ncbi:MAG: hypothetical protein IJ642_12745 [Oscillospiraceae bacterium]|nr:hypothetical protein [Oscillospiraceae bacterium]